jgi:hypothetical protein
MRCNDVIQACETAVQLVLCLDHHQLQLFNAKGGTLCTFVTTVRKVRTSGFKIEVKIGVFLSSLLEFEFGVVVFLMLFLALILLIEVLGYFHCFLLLLDISMLAGGWMRTAQVIFRAHLLSV